MIQAAEQAGHDPPVRAVVVHLDLLADDPLLLLDGLLGEVGLVHHAQQDIQTLVHLLGGGEQIAGFVKAGVGVGRRTGPGKLGKGVAVLALKHFMLQEMGHARGQTHPAAVHLKFQVDGAEAGAVDGVDAAVAGHGPHQNGQAVFQRQGLTGHGGAHRLHGFILHGWAPPFWSQDSRPSTGTRPGSGAHPRRSPASADRPPARGY